jgi:hypothetical protein
MPAACAAPACAPSTARPAPWLAGCSRGARSSTAPCNEPVQPASSPQPHANAHTGATGAKAAAAAVCRIRRRRAVCGTGAGGLAHGAYSPRVATHEQAGILIIHRPALTSGLRSSSPSSLPPAACMPTRRTLGSVSSRLGCRSPRPLRGTVPAPQALTTPHPNPIPLPTPPHPRPRSPAQPSACDAPHGVTRACARGHTHTQRWSGCGHLQPRKSHAPARSFSAVPRPMMASTAHCATCTTCTPPFTSQPAAVRHRLQGSLAARVWPSDVTRLNGGGHCSQPHTHRRILAAAAQL